MTRNRRLVVFDVEGVIIPRAFSVSRLPLVKKLGILGAVRGVSVGILYLVGLLSIEGTLRRLFRLFRGLSVSELHEVFEGVPLIPGVEETFAKLRKGGFETALISSAIPSFIVEELAARLHANYAYGLCVELFESRLTGGIGGDLAKLGGKGVVLRKLLAQEGLSPEQCTAVVDGRNNLPMYPLCALKIGFNPDFMVTARSDEIVGNSLEEVLPLLGLEASAGGQREIARRAAFRNAIHMSGFLVAILCNYISLNVLLVASLLVLVAIAYAASELLRLMGRGVFPFSTITRHAAVGSEIWDFSAAPIFLALSVALSLIMFPPPLAYASIAIVTLGDSVASLSGRAMGMHRIPFNRSKSLEGSIIGFTAAAIGASLFIEPLVALIGAAIAMLLEHLPSPVDDNLSMPLASGLVLSLIS